MVFTKANHPTGHSTPVDPPNAAEEAGESAADKQAEITQGELPDKPMDPKKKQAQADFETGQVLRNYIIKMGHKDPGEGASLTSLHALATALKLQAEHGDKKASNG